MSAKSGEDIDREFAQALGNYLNAKGHGSVAVVGQIRLTHRPGASQMNHVVEIDITGNIPELQKKVEEKEKLK